MPAIGNKYILTLRSHASTNSQAIQNVFAYELTAGTGGSTLLTSVFQTEIVLPLSGVLNDQTIIDDMYCVNLDDPTDFTTDIIGGTGTVTGEALPAFNCWEFEYIRTNRTVNNGRKAFALVAEGSQAGGFATPTTLTNLQALAALLAGDLEDVPSGSVWTPRIFRRPGIYTAGAVLPPGLFFPISSVVYRRISSQNTRKTGRGI